MSNALPIQAIKGDLLAAWSRGGAIVSAPPGSGKTTQLPLWLLEPSSVFAMQNTVLTGPIYLLIPKRLAVKLAANQLARNFGEDVGDTIGYQLRNDQKISAKTRITVTTYGSFLRILLNNPDQLGQATVIFDEFHERSVEQDLCYALVNQYVDYFDEHVRRIIMSATLNVDKIASQTQLPLIESEGFSYPVDVHFQKTEVKNSRLVAPIIEAQWQTTDDHLLVFCPGLAEIRQLEQQLAPNIPVLILHGQLSATPNLGDLEKAASTVILATNIAESSVTLPRVHTVVDLGLERFASIHPVTGITELKTRQISQASATQRTGRAGRLAPGKCIRLWSADEHKALVAHQPAEITLADLTDTVMHCLQWGTTREELVWLDQPSASRWQLAVDKLRHWRAIDSDGQLNAHGLAMQKIGLQPWLSHLIAVAQAHENLVGAALLAAHLTTGQPVTYDTQQTQSIRNFSKAIVQEFNLVLKRFQHPPINSIPALPQHILVSALADRVIQWRTHNQGQLINGSEVQSTHATNEAWGLLLDGIRQGQRIKATSWLAVSADIIKTNIPVITSIHFQPATNRSFVQVKRLGKIILSEQSYSPSEDERMEAWSAFILEKGEQAFQWDANSLALKNRWLMANLLLSEWPQWPTQDEWQPLASAFFSGVKRLEQLPLLPMLEHALGYPHLQKLEALLPIYWQAPTSRQVAIEYDPAHKKAKVSIKLQEIFGLAQHPLVANTLPLTLDLTAPNGRPVASVTDLSHFWRNVYPDVRKELRGRYVKHPWPEDPITFQATAKTNRQLRLDDSRK